MIDWVFHSAEGVLQSAFGTASQQLRVIAPYIKETMLRRLLERTDPDVPLTVVTQWTVADLLHGSSDLGVYDLVASRPGSALLLCPRLHAKLYIVDIRECFTGSANLTAAGLGTGDRPNREILARFEPVPLPLLQFAMDLLLESFPATEALRDRYAGLVAAHPALGGEPPEPSMEDLIRSTAAGASTLAHLPRSRNPDYLFRVYAGHDPDPASWAVEAAAADLALLAVPAGLNEADFRAWVGKRLLAIPIVSAFDQYLEQPRYFGRMTDWLDARSSYSPLTRPEVKERLQTLMRWLQWAYPGRYRLETPRFSERFGRAQANWGNR